MKLLRLPLTAFVYFSVATILAEAALQLADETGLDPETQAPFLGLLKQECAGESEVENRNPSDLDDLIGLYAQASADQVEVDPSHLAM